MIKLYKLEDEIKEILESNKIARTDDHILYTIYWHKKAPQVSFFEFWKSPRSYNASQFSAVERCRRKLQAKYPELKDPKAADARFEMTMDYEQYALGR